MTALVVLDIDDTLYLERDYVRSGFAAVEEWVSRNLAIHDVYAQAWALFESGVRGTTISDALALLGVDVDAHLLAAVVDVYRTHKPAISLCPDARQFMRRTPEDWHLAIVSDGPAQSQRAKACALGLPAIAAPIVLTAERGPDWHKPSPLAFQEVQAAHDVPANRCIYVADNPVKDFQAPAGLGWKTVRIRRSGALHAAVEKGTAAIDRTFALLDVAQIAEVLATP